MCSLHSEHAGEADESAADPDPCRTPMQRRGVLLINLGTPDGPDLPSVRSYLAEFLSDPEIIRLPHGLRWMNPLLGRLISRFRASASAEKYRKIWNHRGSPLRTITQQQAAALEPLLPSEMRVFSAMRYGSPSIPETVRHIESLGIEELVVVPMYPQYSGTTTRTAVRELYRIVNRAGCKIDVTMRSIWYDDAGYINAQARLIRDYAAAHGLTPANCHLVFSSHSLPVSYVKRGDPYADQITRTARLVSKRLGWPSDRASLCFQSRLGPVKWLRPATAELLAKLAAAGEKQLLVCPLSFTTDCLESLEEIGIRYRAMFEKRGRRLHLCPALNASEPFITALKNLVTRGRHPMTFAEAEASPLMKPEAAEVPPAEAPTDALVMVGMSLGARLETGRGPHLAAADEQRFRAAKHSQCDVPEILRQIADGQEIREALLWNTCRRFELYAWLGDKNASQNCGTQNCGTVVSPVSSRGCRTGASPVSAERQEACATGDAGLGRKPGDAARARIVRRIRDQLFVNGHAHDPTVNVLTGTDAYHHLLRTTTGLNSTLPGERDVAEQLDAAHRLAQRAGAAGPLVDRLLSDVRQQERTLRDETQWGRFDPDYCYATISRIVQTTGLDLPDCRSTVIGGSTTSCSILRTLRQRFDVSPRQLTLLHRGHGHGGHLKMLRKAIGHGRRIRVGSYGEQSVIKAIAGSDVVFLGIDRKEPILDAEQIRRCRDFGERSLTIIDFNMFSSTSGMDTLEGVHLFEAEDLEAAVEDFAAEMCGTEQFALAVEAAEVWIQKHVPQSAKISRRGAEIAEISCNESPSASCAPSREAQDRQSAIRKPRSAAPAITTGDNGMDLNVFRKYAGLSLPRHVSYPMPSWWHEIEPAEAEAMLRAGRDSRESGCEKGFSHQPPRDLSLYLHVPFCEWQCKFCACTRITLRKTEPGALQRVACYVRAMQQEIRRLGEMIGPGRRVRQIHWGGGSPTYLAPESIKQICDTIAEAFTIADDVEIAMEIDPRRAQLALLGTLRRLGFNRVSLGVQDFDKRVQEHVCRNQPFGLVRDKVDACRELGFASINFDLIYGLPYQTLASLRETIERTIELSPDRIAFYHYAQIPDKIATQRGMHHDKMPDSETKLTMFLTAAGLFGEAGYQFIGLDHFAKPDEALTRALRDKTLQRNFQGMTTGGGLDLIGIGATSISHLPGIGFIQNTRNTDDYVRCMERGRSAARKGKRLTEDDRLRQAVMTQLYCRAEIRPRELEEQFGIDFAEYFAAELEAMRELQRDGLVTVDDENTIRVAFPLGRVLLRTVASPFDAYLDKDAYRVGDRHMFSANA